MLASTLGAAILTAANDFLVFFVALETLGLGQALFLTLLFHCVGYNRKLLPQPRPMQELFLQLFFSLCYFLCILIHDPKCLFFLRVTSDM
mgnify:CR=1 FL=1